MSAEDTELVRRAFDAINEAADGDELRAAIKEFFDPGVRWEVEPEDELIEAGVWEGHEGVQAFLEGQRVAVENLRAEPLCLVDLGDQTLVDLRLGGRMRYTGIEGAMEFFILITLRTGRIARYQVFVHRDKALAAADATTSPESPTPHGDATAAQARALYAAYNRRDWDAFFTILDPELEWSPGLLAPDVDVPELRETPGAQHYRGHAGFVEIWDEWLESFDEIRLTDGEFIDAGDRVVVISRAFCRGRQSGAEIEMEIATVFGVRDGKVALVQLCSGRAEALRVAGLAE